MPQPRKGQVEVDVNLAHDGVYTREVALSNWYGQVIVVEMDRKDLKDLINDLESIRKTIPKEPYHVGLPS